MMEDTDANMAVEAVLGGISAARTCGSVIAHDAARTGDGARHVSEVRMSAFLTATSSVVYDQLAAQTPMPGPNGVNLPATFNSAHRYAFNLAALGGILKAETRWQMPMLSVLRNGALRPIQCVEDVTAAAGAKCVVIATKNPMDRLKRMSDIPALIHVSTRGREPAP